MSCHRDVKPPVNDDLSQVEVLLPPKLVHTTERKDVRRLGWGIQKVYLWLGPFAPTYEGWYVYVLLDRKGRQGGYVSTRIPNEL